MLSIVAVDNPAAAEDLNSVFSPSAFPGKHGQQCSYRRGTLGTAFPSLLMPTVMIVCHELFPTSYLLALAPTVNTTLAETELEAYLSLACRSGRPAVWVDCRLLDTLSTTAAWLLWACQQRLHRRHARLVLCRVPAAVERILQRTLAGAGADLLIVPTLDDAAALA